MNIAGMAADTGRGRRMFRAGANRRLCSETRQRTQAARNRDVDAEPALPTKGRKEVELTLVADFAGGGGAHGAFTKRPNAEVHPRPWRREAAAGTSGGTYCWAPAFSTVPGVTRLAAARMQLTCGVR